MSASIIFPPPDQNALIDFDASWSAVHLLCEGADPYNRSALLTEEQATGGDITEPVVPWHPPWAISLILPFVVVPYKYAKLLWLLCNGLLLIVLADYWWRTSGGATEHRMASWLASIWFLPCAVAIYFGQMSLLVLAGVAGISWSLKEGKLKLLPLFVLAASAKPHLLVPYWIFFILELFRRGRWRLIVWAGSGIILINLFLIGLRPTLWKDYLAAIMSANGPVIWATPTLGTVVRVLFRGLPAWVAFFPTMCGIVLSLFFWRKWAYSFTFEKHLNEILLLSLATSSYAWIFDWALLLPISMTVLVWSCASPEKQWQSIAGLVGVMGVFVWMQANGMFPLGVAWFPLGLAAVYWLARRRQDKVSTAISELVRLS